MLKFYVNFDLDRCDLCCIALSCPARPSCIHNENSNSQWSPPSCCVEMPSFPPVVYEREERQNIAENTEINTARRSNALLTSRLAVF